ncbi:MAG: tetrahydromethanopterin S-methyltransferase subunit B [Methanotrichaceae archaeon]|nr:tetrahydromethanopterin S-methyltransferase subunit B [Methanotrichaceae archaeon]
MGFVRVSPELGLIFDPMKGVVSEQRADVVLYTLDPVFERLEKLDKISTDLVNQLSPDNELLSSYANRGKASYIAGLYTNIWMGFILGLVLSFVVLVAMAMSNPDSIEIVRKALSGGA